MIAYKFLDDGAVAPFTRFRWPVGEWVETDRVEPCRSGIHACLREHLPYWFDRELWEIELAGDIVAQERKLVAQRGRLVRRCDEWNDDVRRAFMSDVLRRTRLQFGSVPIVSGYVYDIDRFRAEGRVGLAAFAAARAAERTGGSRAYERERARQAGWLAGRLGLATH